MTKKTNLNLALSPEDKELAQFMSETLSNELGIKLSLSEFIRYLIRDSKRRYICSTTEGQKH